MASTVPAKNKSKMILATVGVAVIAVGAYGLGRVYPPLGETSGTIAPAERYRSSQVDASSISLGDTEIPKLMQTDAFELMVKDPAFRALASNPGFAALAQNKPAFTALTRDPQSFAALAANQKAFTAAAKAAAAANTRCAGPECFGVRGHGDQPARLPGARPAAAGGGGDGQ